MESPLRIIPLGGLGQIGMNMMVLEYGPEILVIDAGSMFPESHMLGIDLVIPNISYLTANREKVGGLILTHGHEDHIGAVPYVMQELKVPLYGTRMTLGLVREKLEEHRLPDQVQMNTIRPRDVVRIGNFRIEFITVSHSIVDGVGLAIDTPVGLVVHSGDFKLEQTPVDGIPLDFYSFARYGEMGIQVLLSDSTNVEKRGYSPSEKQIGESIEEVFRDPQGRIIITTFASNIHRIQQVVNLAQKYKRKLYINGRSMLTNIRIAKSLGYLRLPDELIVDNSVVAGISKDALVVLTTGSQGEPMSALSLMAQGRHKYIQVDKGDRVILSSRFIPGHERAINNIIDQLYRRGADVIYEKISEVHVSGHASREELKLMLNMTRPRYFIPIHGEYRHLVQHASLAKRVGIPPSRILVAETGDVIEIGRDQAGIKGKVEAGGVFVDGKGIGDIGTTVLRDRQHLAEDGMVVALLVLNKHSGEILSGPDIISRGFVFEKESTEMFDVARTVVLEAMQKAEDAIKSDDGDMEVVIRRALKSFFNRTIRRKPLILPIILEI